MGSVNDIYELRIRGSQQGQEIINTLHFKSAVVGTDASIQQDLIDTWQAAAQTQWLAMMWAPYVLGDVSAQRVCGSLPLPAASSEIVNTAGSRGAVAAGGASPPWMAALIRERTGFAGRSYAGRTFVPIQAEVDCDGVSLHAVYVPLITAYVTALAPLLSGGADADWDLFVRSRKLAEQPGVACQDTGAVVTSMSVSPYLTTMRSRRSRTGA